MGDKGDPLAQEIARIAGRQHGAITHRQLISLGITRNAVSRRARRGELHRVHQGVYAVGHRAPSRHRAWMAAVLACGEGATLSHRSAAELWELLRPQDGPAHVSIAARSGRRRRSGICLHRCSSLEPDQLVRRHRIPVTKPARTLGDLRGTVPEWQWRKAVRQAEFRELHLGPDFETDRTRSDLERDFLRLCRRHGLPAPEVNVKVGSWTVDFLWREERVAVETDFYDYHRGRVAFQDDHVRDLALRSYGLDARHYCEQQLNDEPAALIADLRSALGLDGLPGGALPSKER